MIIDTLLASVTCKVGFTSWSTGFIPTTCNLWDELHRCPTAVFNFLMNNEEWDLAEWVMDNFL